MVLPAPFSPTIATTEPAGSVQRHIVEHDARCAGIGERHVFEADAVGAMRRARADRRQRRPTRRSPPARPGGANRPSRMPRRKPISPTVAPMYAESREPAASTSSTWRRRSARGPSDDEHDRADVGAPEDRPGQRVPDGAEPHRAAATGPYQRSQASRRSTTRRSPMPVTRTSLPGGAVVATVNRWRARRLACAPRSCACRSTAGPPRRA